MKFVVQRLNDAKPILLPESTNSWESRVVLNPACVYVDSEAEISMISDLLQLRDFRKRPLGDNAGISVLIYRAQGQGQFSKSRLGLAILSHDLKLLYRHPSPVVVPEYEFENLGVEDPRVSRIGSNYIMLYTGYSNLCESEALSTDASGKTSICMAISSNLITWTKLGPVEGDINRVSNKNGALFPDQIQGSYYMLHRPMAGDNSMSIHLARCDKLDGEWESLGLFMEAEQNPNFKKSWIGAGAPPITVGFGEYLMIYHTGHYKWDDTKQYNLGLCHVCYRNAFMITDRVENMLTPTTHYETFGDPELGVNNTVFVCGAYQLCDEIFFPYAGADSVILAAKLKLTS